jgi:hypothetical protein
MISPVIFNILRFNHMPIFFLCKLIYSKLLLFSLKYGIIQGEFFVNGNVR